MPERATIEVDAASYQELVREIEAVSRYLTGVRHAINGLGLPGIVDANIRDAYADLRDVVATGQSAAMTILDTAEQLLNSTETGDAYRTQVENKMIELMEACSFQDLTGQRLARVSKSLMSIEERLTNFSGLVKMKSNEGGRPMVSDREKAHEKWKRDNMAYGPSSDNSVNQSDIDKLLSA